MGGPETGATHKGQKVDRAAALARPNSFRRLFTDLTVVPAKRNARIARNAGKMLAYNFI